MRPLNAFRLLRWSPKDTRNAVWMQCVTCSCELRVIDDIVPAITKASAAGPLSSFVLRARLVEQGREGSRRFGSVGGLYTKG